MLGVEDDGSPRAALDVAGQGVRGFLHRSSEQFVPQLEGWRYPSDAYRALGELTYLVGALPQVVQQIMSALRYQFDIGHVGIDDDTKYADDPEAAVEAASVALERATQAAHQMYRAISEAQNAMSAARYTGPELER